MRYVALWVLVSAAYATAFGVLAAMPAWMAAVDGAVFGVVAGFEGLILWSVLKYGTAEMGSPSTAGTPTAVFFRIGKLSLVVVAGLLFIVVAVGAEVLALWIVAERMPAAFPPTIPARSLITAAVYVCFVLWYSSAARSDAGAPRADSYTGRGQVESTSPTEQDGGVPETLERITVRGAGGRIEVIGVDDIVCLQAEGDYVAIVTANGRRLKEGTMKWFEGALPRDRFVRVHRSCIVAVAHISRIETSGRDHTVIMRGVGSVRMSDTGYRLLKRMLGL